MEARSLRIDGPDQFTALAHPVRRRILELAATRPVEVKEMAAELGVSPTRLYRHVDHLLQLGLLEVEAERKVRGLTTRTFVAKTIPAAQAGAIAMPPEGYDRLGATAIALEIDLDSVIDLLHDLASRTSAANVEGAESVVVTISIDRPRPGGK